MGRHSRCQGILGCPKEHHGLSAAHLPGQQHLVLPQPHHMNIYTPSTYTPHTTKHTHIITPTSHTHQTYHIHTLRKTHPHPHPHIIHTHSTGPYPHHTHTTHTPHTLQIHIYNTCISHIAHTLHIAYTHVHIHIYHIPTP